MATILLPSQNELGLLYLNSAQAKANELGIDINITQFSNFQINAAAISGFGAGIIQEVNVQYNNVYPQYSNAQGINLGLANKGIPAIYPATPAILTLTADDLVVAKTYIIPVETIISAPNGSTYQVISTNNDLTEVVLTTLSDTFYAASTAKGLNTTQTDSTVLTFSPPIISTDGSSTLSTATVSSSVDGSDQETLANAANRLIEISQQPLCSTRATDFKYLAIDPDNNVTDAIILINNQLNYSDTQINTGIFDISGTAITDNILNQGLFPGTTEVVFDRTSSPASIANTQSVMDAQDFAGVFINVSTVSTQELTSLTGPDAFFKITVTLQTGFTLSSQITLNGNIFTLEQLIKREARRAICAQPYGATLTINLSTGEYLTSSFAISAMENQLGTSLGTATTVGILGSYLLDRSITTWNGSAYVYTPSISLNLGIPVANTDKLPWIYDVSLSVGNIYSNISVVTA